MPFAHGSDFGVEKTREMARLRDNHGIVMDLPYGTVISHRDIAMECYGKKRAHL
jgi:hypothetical protein